MHDDLALLEKFHQRLPLTNEELRYVVREYKTIFRECPLGQWNVSQVTDMRLLFYQEQTLSRPLTIDDIWFGPPGELQEYYNIFHDFNEDISAWDVSNVTDMTEMFYGARAFNQPIGSWNVGKVTSMKGMFYDARAFNQPLTTWDVSNVTTMENMFAYTDKFNQPLQDWNVGKVTNMDRMFFHSGAFNQPLTTWDVSNVESMSGMFAESVFNLPIGMWNVSKVLSMERMFAYNKHFNQSLEEWKIHPNCDLSAMFFSTNYNQPWFRNVVFRDSKTIHEVLKNNTVYTHPVPNHLWHMTGLTKRYWLPCPFQQPGTLHCPMTWERPHHFATVAVLAAFVLKIIR